VKDAMTRKALTSSSGRRDVTQGRGRKAYQLTGELYHWPRLWSARTFLIHLIANFKGGDRMHRVVRARIERHG